MIVIKDTKRLKQDIIDSGNTMTSISENLKCSKAFISSILSGTRNPNAKIAIGLCEILGKQFEVYFYIMNVNKKLTG